MELGVLQRPRAGVVGPGDIEVAAPRPDLFGLVVEALGQDVSGVVGDICEWRLATYLRATLTGFADSAGNGCQMGSFRGPMTSWPLWIPWPINDACRPVRASVTALTSG
jgi:hypothetical protein